MARTVWTPVSSPTADRCPGTVALHKAQDGWLARVRVPGGRLGGDQLRALADGAALGNGLVDLTSRANLQVRGLPAYAGDALAALLRGVGLLPSPAHDRARNVIASPVAGRHPLSRVGTDAVVAAIERGVCAEPALARLPGRFLFAVDDGAGLALDQPADVALVARDADGYRLALAGHVVAEPVAAADAAATAVHAALGFVDERAARSERASRISELAAGPATIARRLGLAIAGELCTLPAGQLAPGRLRQRDGRTAVTGLVPLGRLETAGLVALAALAPEVRLGTGRTVTVVDVEPAAEAQLERDLGALGLVLGRESGWVGLTACAGLRRCPKARLDVRAAAAARARVRGPGAPAEHWAACERRCGERSGQPIAVGVDGAGIAVRTAAGESVVANVEQALAVLE
jgi:sulfite reductase beta subunit-like hemoprotein